MLGPLCLLCLSASFLLHNKSVTAKSLPGGRGVDVSVGGARRQRRELHDFLPSEAQMMSYPVAGGSSELYYQPEWRRGLDQALQRLVESNQRQEEQQEAAYLVAMLRLLSEAESVGLVGPGGMEVMEEEEEEEGPALPDYDETGQMLSRPQLAQLLRDRARSSHLRPTVGRSQRLFTGSDPETLRLLVSNILTSIGPSDPRANRRARRDLAAPIRSAGANHRRARRSLDDAPPPPPSSDPPLLRVKRLGGVEQEEGGWRGGEEGGGERHQEAPPPSVAALQRMKRIDAMATTYAVEGSDGSRRQRRSATYDPALLAHQLLLYLQE